MKNPYDWTRLATPRFVGREDVICNLIECMRRGEGVLLRLPVRQR